MFKYSVQIKEHHLDTFGHVNNATYLALYEEARWQLVTERGFGLKEVQARQQGPVILEVNVKFMKELRLRETITITTEALDHKGKVGSLKQQMLLSSGEAASEAIIKYGFFDLKTRRLIEPSPEWKYAVGIQ
jgi:YbgC/YbaW family acyl-CoA thioester hydrolase